MSRAALPAPREGLLVVCPTWIGDTVMATPLLRAARQAHPGARLVALARPAPAALLEGAAWLDEIIVAPNRGWRGPAATARLARARARCDAALLLPNSFRWALTLRLAAVPVRAGYARDGRGRLLTHRLAPPPRERPVPAVDYYLELATWAFGVERPEPRLELAVTRADEAAAAPLLQGLDDPLVVINPGANRPDKRWPAERFAAVAAALVEAHGASVAVSGAPGEADLVRAVVEAVPAGAPVADLVARGVTLGGLKGVLRRAALLVGNDTGPRHVAAALGTPAVSLFGPTDHRWTTLPAGTPQRILLAEPFLPETLTADRFSKLCAIERIAIDDVLAASAALLGAGSGRSAAAPRAGR